MKRKLNLSQISTLALLLTISACMSVCAYTGEHRRGHAARSALVIGRFSQAIDYAPLYVAKHFGWFQANSALKMIYDESKPVWREVNFLAAKQIDWSAVGSDSTDYLRAVMAVPDA